MTAEHFVHRLFSRTPSGKNSARRNQKGPCEGAFSLRHLVAVLSRLYCPEAPPLLLPPDCVELPPDWLPDCEPPERCMEPPLDWLPDCEPPERCMEPEDEPWLRP